MNYYEETIGNISIIYELVYPNNELKWRVRRFERGYEITVAFLFKSLIEARNTMRMEIWG